MGNHATAADKIVKMLSRRVGADCGNVVVLHQSRPAYTINKISCQYLDTLDNAWLVVLAIGEQYEVEVHSKKGSGDVVVLIVCEREWFGKELACFVGHAPFYGNEDEVRAVNLKPNDQLWVDGKRETVVGTFFYDGIAVRLANGRTLIPGFRGDRIVRVD